MKNAKIFGLLLLQFFCFNVFSLNKDSLQFIDSVRKFAFQKIEFTPSSDFFTKWKSEEKPFVYLYVSRSDSVKKPEKLISSYIFLGTDETQVDEEEVKWKDGGYHTFRYKTYANSNALLNKRLLSYSNEAVAFIIFHELIHVYIAQQNMKIPYEFNEALCDVVGNYGTLEYSLATRNLDLTSVNNQIKSNEKIYKCLNNTISKINRNQDKITFLNARCNDTIKNILKRANSFQKDRFEYKVNNAYLLKNEYYCKNYFLLKSVFLKQKSLKAFLELMKELPEGSLECEKYFKQFI